MGLKTLSRCALAVSLMSGITFSAQAEVVGKMTAERATITKSGTGRIRAGAPISQGDSLSANSSGSGMIVFDDESSARLGPNAKLVIDDFVYNPSRRSGTIKLRQTAGAARIFGGQISKRGRSEVRTPHIVLGVRGGVVDVVVARGVTTTTLRAGVMTCRAGGKKRTVTNPGFSCRSDGRTLEVGKLGANSRQFVDGATSSGSSGRQGSAQFCSSNAGIGHPSCTTRDTGLPGISNPRTRNPLGRGPAGTACDPGGGTGECL